MYKITLKNNVIIFTLLRKPKKKRLVYPFPKTGHHAIWLLKVTAVTVGPRDLTTEIPSLKH